MPREIPSKEQIAKLPKWAQDYISSIESERNQAIRSLKNSLDNQTESVVFYDEHPCIGTNLETGENSSGPAHVRHYIQTKRVQFKLPRAEMELEVYVNEEEQRVEIRTPKGYPYIEPQGSNCFNLVPKEDMYLTPNAVTLLRASYEFSALGHDAFYKKYGFRHDALPEMIQKVVPKSHWKRTVSG